MLCPRAVLSAVRGGGGRGAGGGCYSQITAGFSVPTPLHSAPGFEKELQWKYAKLENKAV